MNNTSAIYPWQTAVWQQMQASRQRLPHAILLHGRAGIGKFHFAKALSQSLLCKNANALGDACQHCSSCHWFHDESHPDLRILSPEQEAEAESDTAKKPVKKKNHISIAQIRDLNAFIHLSSHQATGLRIVLIHPAEALNIASANALLKMLEEPANNVVFILVTHQIQRLLPTVLSRCHQISMPMPEEQDAVNWLTAQGIKAPQMALAYFSNAPMHVAEQAEGIAQFEEIWRLLALGQALEPALTASKLIVNSVETGISVFQKWLYDLVALKSGCQIRYHLTQTKALQQLASKVNLNALFDLQKKTQSLKMLALHPLNHALQLECLLFDYTKIFSSK